VTDDLRRMGERVRRIVAPDADPSAFDPLGSWEDLGRLVDGMEGQGYYLMVSTARMPHLKRMAAFHVVTKEGFPCAGSSGWGPFETIAEAVLRAADEALYRPRNEEDPTR